MISNLFITFMIVGSIGGATNSAYLTKKETPTNHQITTPNKQNEIQNFSLNLTKYNETGSQISLGTDKNQYSNKIECRGENSALNVKMESITQTENNTNTANPYPTILERPTPFTNTLNKYEITPYRYLTNVENKTTLTINLKLSYSELMGGPNNQQNSIDLKIKVTTYMTTNNWDKYMGMSNWYTQQSNGNIINEIENPENEQTFTKKENIYSLNLTTNPGWKVVEINEEIEIIKYNENSNIQQNYIFMYIQPYYESIQYGNYISYGANANMWAVMATQEGHLQINGYMIPPVQNYEVIDIPGLLFNILTMPFAFISTAFNLTLFPGTPYQINLSNLFLTIMAILIFVFIVKIFVKIKG